MTDDDKKEIERLRQNTLDRVSYYTDRLPVTMPFGATDNVRENALKIAHEQYDCMYHKVRADLKFDDWLPIFLRGFMLGADAHLNISSLEDAIKYLDFTPLHKWGKEPYDFAKLWPKELGDEFIAATRAFQEGEDTDGEILLVIDKRIRTAWNVVGITGWYSIDEPEYRSDYGLRWTAIHPEFQKRGYGLGTITALIHRLKHRDVKDDVVFDQNQPLVRLHQLCDREETMNRFTLMGFFVYEDKLADKVRTLGGNMKYVMLTDSWKNSLAWFTRGNKTPSHPVT